MAFSQTTSDSITDQLRQVIKDGVDYMGSVINLLQARVTEMALSSVVFVALIIGASIFGFAAIVLMVVALGFWLTHLTGHVGWALLILGGVLGISALVAARIALRWLSQLKS